MRRTCFLCCVLAVSILFGFGCSAGVPLEDGAAAYGAPAVNPDSSPIAAGIYVGMTSNANEFYFDGQLYDRTVGTSSITQTFNSAGEPLDLGMNPIRADETFIFARTGTDQLLGTIKSVVASEDRLSLNYSLQGTMGGGLAMSGIGTTTFTVAGPDTIQIEINADLSGIEADGTVTRVTMASVGTLTK